MQPSLRHLRLFAAIADTGSLSQAARACHVSQPAATQALTKMERRLQVQLFQRKPHGLEPTPHGHVLLSRSRRALSRLDRALAGFAPRLKQTATLAQLRALAAVVDAENHSLAARQLGLSQPTVHRAVSNLSKDAGRALFERTSVGFSATRLCRELSVATKLTFAELDQALADLAALDGKVSGRVKVGALPLSRATILPKALVKFRNAGWLEPVEVVDGAYTDLLRGVLQGDIHALVGALRTPSPSAELKQEVWFQDTLVILARPNHPVLDTTGNGLYTLQQQDWIVPRRGTPAREQFDAVLAQTKITPRSVVGSGSILLMRELLLGSDVLGCISRQQAQAELAHGLLAAVPAELPWADRPIGLATREDFVPTRAQAFFIDTLRSIARDVD